MENLMAINFSDLQGGGLNDEGATLIASFNYDTVGRTVSQAFEAGLYLATVYAPTSSTVFVYTEDSSSNTLLNLQKAITESPQSMLITLGSNITKVLVKGSSEGAIVIRKMPTAPTGSISATADLTSWQTSAGPVLSQNIADFAVSGNEVLTAVTGTSSTDIYHSTDSGQSWTTVPSVLVSRQWTGFVKSASRWVGFCEDGSTTRWASSADKINWTNATYATSVAGNYKPSGLAVNGNTVVAVNSKFGAYQVFYSNDGGSNFSEAALPNNGDNYCANSYVGGYFVAPGYNGPNVAYSTNGSSWSNNTSGVPNQGGVVGYKDGVWYLPSGGAPGIGGGTTSVVFTTTNLANAWTQSSLPISAYWGAISLINNTLIMTQFATGGSYPGEILTSTDGATWTRRTGPNVSVAKLHETSDGIVVGAVYASSEAAPANENRILTTAINYEVV
jgi:hypothetical protein